MSFSSVLAELKPRPGEDLLRFAAQTLAVLLPVFLVIGRAAADWGLSLTAVLFLAHCFRRREWAWLREPWVRAALVLWAWMFVSAAGGADFLQSVGRVAAWIRFPVFAAAMTFWAVDRVWLRRFVAVAAAVLAVVAADTLFQFVTGQDVLGHVADVKNRRLTGPFKDKQVGIFIAKMAFLPFMPLFIGAVQGKRKGPAALTGGVFLVLLLTVVASGERMATLLFLLGLVLTIIFLPALRRFVLALGVTAAVGVGAVLVLSPGIAQRHVDQTIQTVENFSGSPYGLIWRNALTVSAEHPVFGVGPKNFRNACTCKTMRECGANGVLCALHPHNTYLEWLAETGVPGLLGFLVLVGLWLAQLAKALRQRPPPLYALGAWVAVCLGLWPFSATGGFFSNWNAVLFWLAVAVALAATERQNGETPAPALERSS